MFAYVFKSIDTTSLQTEAAILDYFSITEMGAKCFKIQAFYVTLKNNLTSFQKNLSTKFSFDKHSSYIIVENLSQLLLGSHVM